MIQEPADPLWPPVKAITGWIETNEDVLGDLPAAWERGAAAFEAAARFDPAGLRGSWRDDGGTEYLMKLGDVLKASADTVTGLRQGAALATNLTNQIVAAKQGIVDTIAANSAVYASLLSIDAGVRASAQTDFVNQVAGIVKDIMAKAEAAIRGLANTVTPGAPPPAPPGDGGETAKLVGDIAGMVSAVAGTASLIPGVAIVAAPIALASGLIALGAHGLAAWQGADAGWDIAGDVVGLVPGGKAAIAGFRAVDETVGTVGRLAGSWLAVADDAQEASQAARTVGGQLAPHLPGAWGATGEGVGRVLQGGSGLLTQVPTAREWVTGEQSGDSGKAATAAGIGLNVAGMAKW